jgi:hypothetical protein
MARLVENGYRNRLDRYLVFELCWIVVPDWSIYRDVIDVFVFQVYYVRTECRGDHR